jgi:hypothetical protein
LVGVGVLVDPGNGVLVKVGVGVLVDPGSGVFVKMGVDVGVGALVTASLRHRWILV